MKISIRKSKHQKAEMTDNQMTCALACIKSYREKGHNTYFVYNGTIENEKISCDIYTTKTQISAVVYHG